MVYIILNAVWLHNVDYVQCRLACVLVTAGAVGCAATSPESHRAARSARKAKVRPHHCQEHSSHSARLMELRLYVFSLLFHFSVAGAVLPIAFGGVANARQVIWTPSAKLCLSFFPIKYCTSIYNKGGYGVCVQCMWRQTWSVTRPVTSRRSNTRLACFRNESSPAALASCSSPSLTSLPVRCRHVTQL